MRGARAQGVASESVVGSDEAQHEGALVLSPPPPEPCLTEWVESYVLGLKQRVK